MKIKILGLLSLVASIVVADPQKELENVIKEFWDFRMKENPAFATGIGDHTYDDKVREVTIATLDNNNVIVENILEKLKKINKAELPSKDQVNYSILFDILSTYLAGYKWKDFTYCTVNFLEGVQKGYRSLVEAMLFNDLANYETYLKRLAAIAVQINQNTDFLKESLKVGKPMHNASIERVPAQMEKALNIPIKNSYFYLPFKSMLDNITSISEAKKKELKDQAEPLIQNIYNAYTDMKNYIEKEYLSKTRPDIGISSLQGGADFYQAALKWHLSLSMTAQEVHDLGKKEVARITEKMNEIMKDVGFDGNLKEFVGHLKNQSEFFFKTEDELLNEYRFIIEKVIKPKLPLLFKDMPGLPLQVRAMEDDGPGGQYIEGTEDGKRPGIFEANVRKPETRPKFDMTALCLHEADPGHHMQISYMLTQTLPKFRKHVDYMDYFRIPFHFPFFTAYTEGWALYSELLGEEMNVYRTKYELFGRYVSEMFRACRLVVDTGMHALGWTRQQAIDYMAERITDPIHQIEVEIDRYITWPGQACAYKVGDLLIQEYRKNAETQLGSKFDVKEFHLRILASGSMSIGDLGRIVDKYIADASGVATVRSEFSFCFLIVIMLFVKYIIH